jgi:hypothetical protein
MSKDMITLLGKHFPSESDIRNGKLTENVLADLDKKMDEQYLITNKYAQFADKCIPKTVKNEKASKKLNKIFDKIEKDIKQVKDVVQKLNETNIDVVEPLLDPLINYKKSLQETILNSDKFLKSSYDQLIDLYDKYDEEFEHLAIIKNIYEIIVQLFDRSKDVEKEIEMMVKEKLSDKIQMKKDILQKLRETKNIQISKIEEEIKDYGKRIKVLKEAEQKLVKDFNHCVSNIVDKKDDMRELSDM